MNIRVKNMQNYETYQNVDFITFSTLEYIPIDDLIGQPQTTNPYLKNYNRAIVYPIGIIEQWHDTQPRQKRHITMSGKTLENMRLAGITDMETVKHLQSLKKPKFGRVDIAITSWEKSGEDHELTPEYCWKQYQAGNCKTRLTADKPIVDIDKKVETFFIGKRDTRDRLLRVYDKGLELGDVANKIIRIELESRAGANGIAHEIAEGRNIGQMIARYVDYPNDKLWKQIVANEPVKRYRLPDTKKQKSNAKKQNWLLKSVAPAMADLMLEIGYDNEFWDTFSERIAYIYNAKLDEST